MSRSRYNTLDKCSYESSDTGAFYTCGQQANAFVNRGNELRHSLFKNIRNTEGSGVQGITIQVHEIQSLGLQYNFYERGLSHRMKVNIWGGIVRAEGQCCPPVMAAAAAPVLFGAVPIRTIRGVNVLGVLPI